MFDSFVESLDKLLATAKDVPTEKIAVLGLVVISALAIVTSRGPQGGGSGS